MLGGFDSDCVSVIAVDGVDLDGGYGLLHRRGHESYMADQGVRDGHNGLSLLFAAAYARKVVFFSHAGQVFPLKEQSWSRS